MWKADAHFRTLILLTQNIQPMSFILQVGKLRLRKGNMVIVLSLGV
jgi:hypothetical protein